MRQSDASPPMLAKSSSASSTSLRSDILPSSRAMATMSADSDPEAVLEEIRDLITDHLFAARRLAAEASVRFHDHDGIRNADRILNQGR